MGYEFVVAGPVVLLAAGFDAVVCGGTGRLSDVLRVGVERGSMRRAEGVVSGTGVR